MKDFPVDFVITWVDGSDPAWRKKKALAEDGKMLNVEANIANRFTNSDEIRYALRAIVKNCPWFHKIYIVTDAQWPAWLNLDQERVVVVDHQDIFDATGILPNFNSAAIESFLHHIPNLSEHYITLNDDFFIGRKLSKRFFFTDNGVPKIFTSAAKDEDGVKKALTSEAYATQALYTQRLNNSRTAILSKTGALILNEPKHTLRPYKKTDMYEVEKLFAQEVQFSRSCQFRHADECTFLVLSHYYMLSLGRMPHTVQWGISRSGQNYLWKFDYWKVSMGRNRRINTLEYFLISLLKTAFICVNDDKVTTDEDRAKMKKFLQKMYKSPAVGIEKVK